MAEILSEEDLGFKTEEQAPKVIRMPKAVSEAKMTLTADGAPSITVSHAILSGRARVAIAQILADAPEDPLQSTMLRHIGNDPELLAIAARGEGAKHDLLTKLQEKGIDVVALAQAAQGVGEVEATQHANAMTYRLFRVAVDQRSLTTEWKERIASDDYLETQNVVEMEAFIASFRYALGK